MEAPRGTVRKSIHGIPFPVYPRGINLRREARIARRRFYPVTVMYTAYALLVLARGLRPAPGTTLGAFALGGATWTWLEYQVHRFVLHGRFPDGSDRIRHALHEFFDSMHGDHHLRPWDGMYINGFLDTLPFAVALAAASYAVPLRGAPAFVAALLQCYVVEEWVHYSVHFHRFRSRYFDYIRRHHLYHHSPRGVDLAYGLTSGLWDAIEGTRIPDADRVLLYLRADCRPGRAVPR
jgi:sterol desaturase/sphingolipid hydroxylase (fatty acid hydroxylase superfamily)